VKTIGMIGGMSWESSAIYYRIVNREVQRRLGGVHSAKVLLWSFDLGEIEALQAAGDWKSAGNRMRAAAVALARGGADFLIICCNTMHILAEAVEDASGLPLLHIATPLGAAIHAKDLRRVGVLGTRYTMTADFLRSPLVRDHNIEIITPGEDDARETHRLIYEELSRGQFLDSSSRFLRAAIQTLAERGAEGVILGCTELSLLVKPEESEIPLFDTAELHALAAVDRALA
jgi:aspartate racemase